MLCAYAENRSLPQARRIVGSGDENGTSVVGPGQRSRFLVLTKRSAASGDETGLGLAKEVNHHFLENDYGDLSFFFCCFEMSSNFLYVKSIWANSQC